MPTSYSWTLLNHPPAASSTIGGTSGSPTIPCPVDAFTQQDFLDLFERLLPAHYLEPLKKPGPGYELLQAFAQMFSRLSLAVERLGCGSFILTASGGAFATGTVELYRPTPNIEGITVVVKAGTKVKSSRSGRAYFTTADVTFLPGDLGPFLVGVRAEAQGYEYNEPGIVVAFDGTLLEGEIDTIDTLVEDPDLGDLSIRVRHPVPTEGGVDAYLDLHGIDRGIPRGPSEDDTTYRGRIRALPDNISPDAVDRAMQQLLLPYGQTYQFIETWDVSYQTCWDAPPDPIAGSNYDPNLFCFDDPRTQVQFRNRWMDVNEMRGAIVVVVPAFGPVQDVGMAYDDTAVNATALTNPLGLRAVGAWDVPASLAFGVLQGCWDGYDLVRASTMKTVYDTLQRIKAAGVAAALELQGE